MFAAFPDRKWSFSTLNRKKHKLFLTYCGPFLPWCSSCICRSSSTLLTEGKREVFV